MGKCDPRGFSGPKIIRFFFLQLSSPTFQNQIQTQHRLFTNLSAIFNFGCSTETDSVGKRVKTLPDRSNVESSRVSEDMARLCIFPE